MSIFNGRSQMNIEAWNLTNLSEPKQFQRALQLSSLLSANSNEKAWLDWQLATTQAINSDGTAAVTRLEKLINSDQNLVPQDQAYLAAGRVFYQNGKLEGALKYYGNPSCKGFLIIGLSLSRSEPGFSLEKNNMATL